MHPDATFRMEEDAARAFVADEGFGMLFVSTPDGPRVAQVPVVSGPGGTLRFHLGRRNAMTPHLAGATALFVAQGPHAYISPRWYATGPDAVPTWNYVSVEVEGIVQPIDHAGLREQVDAMADKYEAEPKWSVAGMDPRKAEGLFGAITGFELVPVAWRGTVKLSQNKPAEVRDRVADALGDHVLAAWMHGA